MIDRKAIKDLDAWLKLARGNREMTKILEKSEGEISFLSGRNALENICFLEAEALKEKWQS